MGALVMISLGCTVAPPGWGNTGVNSDETGAVDSDSPTMGDDGTSLVDSSGNDSSDDGGGDGIKLDVAAGTGGSGPDPDAGQGCQTVDFLFVIDNSESMEDDQVRLIAAFPEFIDGIQNTIQAQDYHIGVITTDDHVYDHDVYYLGGDPTECDVMGGLVTENWDYQTDSHRICGPFVSGANYLTEAEPDLADQFSCVAFVDDQGSTDEQPFAAIEAALQQPSVSCNDGFLRDDAILVVVLITDEDDDDEPGGNPGSGGDPSQWFDVIVAAKQGNMDNVVFLALAGTSDCPYEHTVRIEALVDMFGDRGFLGSVCTDDYGDFFTDSVSVVDQACDEFTPEG